MNDGIGNKQSFFVQGLQLMFIYLKVTNQVDWSWLWVISPTLIVWGLLFIACVFNSLGDD